MLAKHRFENSRPDGFGVLELERTAGQRVFALLKTSALVGEVHGPLATLRLTQVFGFSEPAGKVVEALYRFPLPGDAAVMGVSVRFGEVEIQAELKRRDEAETAYAVAKAQGRQAALAMRESPDVFTLKIAGLTAGETVTVETRYVHLARPEGTQWILRVPLTTAPRFVREDEGFNRHAHGQPLALLHDPGHRFSLNLLLKGIAEVESATHALDTIRENDGLRVRLKDGNVLPDRDCLLALTATGPESGKDRAALHVFQHRDAATGNLYFLALVAPPAVRDSGTCVPRDVVLLVDHSGSMEGAKWDAADWAVRQFLSGLREQDRFALGLFHNSAQWFSKKLNPGTQEQTDAAVAFLLSHRESGGTELGVALEQALRFTKSGGEWARHVLIVTDAEVSDADRLIMLARQDGTAAKRRISLICIDAAPNEFLCHELAGNGGGVARYLTSEAREEDVTGALDEILQDWSEPVLANLGLSVNRPSVQCSGGFGVLTEGVGSRLELGDLPAGRARWICGRIPASSLAASSGTLTFSLRTPEHAIATVTLDPTAGAEAPGLKALFGARRILDLEHLAGLAGLARQEMFERLGYDPATTSASPVVYAANGRMADAIAARELLAREALEFGLASSETAFVAVRHEMGKRIQETLVVANAVPAGGVVRDFSRMATMTRGGSVTISAANPAPMMLCEGDLEEADASIHFVSASPPPPPRRMSKSVSRMRAPAPVPHDIDACAAPSTPEIVAFSGKPAFSGGQAVLFDTDQPANAARLAKGAKLTRIRVVFPDQGPGASTQGVMLQIFVNDRSVPSVHVRLSDLLRMGGVRPLNIQRTGSEPVRIVLADPKGVWDAGWGGMVVVLGT